MTNDKPRPAVIRLFLAQGTAEGFRMIEKSNWTGLGLVSSRADYLAARQREEWARPGVYFLTADGEDSTRPLLYVGEADDVRNRVDNHVKNKDFWTGVVAFTSKDGNLNKAHVRYLEARLLALAAAADRVTLLNGTGPALPRLSEADRAEMEGYLSEMLVILPLTGVIAFQAVQRQQSSGDDLVLTGRGAQAKGTETSEGFIVFEGSLARCDEVTSINPGTTRLRARLLLAGVLVAEGEHLRFAKAHLFDSPSTAAAVVLGRTANGRIEWKDRAGRTLKVAQEAALDGSPQTL